VILSVSTNRRMLKIICQCDLKHIMMLPIKTITLVMKVSKYIITNVHLQKDIIIVHLYKTHLIWVFNLSCEFESHSGKMHLIQHYVIKFFNDLRHVSSFLRVLQFPPYQTHCDTSDNVCLDLQYCCYSICNKSWC
jgi:hypothetical protein